VSLQNYLGVVGSWVTVVTGVIFVLCVLVFRRGIVGEIIEVTRRVRKGRQGADAGATPARSSSSP
jgi:branched-chain amino acid transport system permease protein